MAWFLLAETKTTLMGWAPYEPMMPAAQGLDTRSWLGGRWLLAVSAEAPGRAPGLPSRLRG